jgi:general secretion pathway protein D
MGNRIHIIAAWAAMGAWLLSGHAVRAQSNTAPATLMDMSSKEDGAARTELTVTFSPTTPDYRVVGNDTRHITLHLLNTGGTPASSSLGTQLLHSAIVQPSGLDLDIIIETAANAHVTVRRSSATTLVAEIRDSRAPNAATAAHVADGYAQPDAGLPVVTDPPPGQDDYVMIPLKYADVSEVVGLLSDGVTIKSNDSFTPQEPGFGSQGMNNGAPAPNTQPSVDDKPLGQAVDSSIAVDRRLNAIWIKGSPAHIARVKAEIAEIDQPVVSVMLETEIVELTETGASALGLDFANSNGSVAVGTYQTGQYVTASYGSGVSRLASGALQAALYAQIQKGQGKIISSPRIAAQSGSSAKIITGDALPILTAITLSGVNGVSQQVQYVNVGVTLQIAPRVSADGDVTSHVFCVVSSVTGYSQGYPTISQRNAETSATVHDGQSFVIGGLTQDQTMSSASKIPLLGDIPLVGGAFAIDRRSRSKTDLYIVITPHIITRKSSAPASQ